MNFDDTDQAIRRIPPAGRWRWAALLAVLVALGLGVAACGGGPSKASSSSSAAGSSADSGSSEAVKFTQCMRSHGVPKYPDPSMGANGQQNSGNLSGIDTNSSTFQAAQQACQQYIPSANASSGQHPPNQSERIKHAVCMRKHGLPNYPDPGSNGQTVITPGSGINVQSPTFQAAAKACQNLLNGG